MQQLSKPPKLEPIIALILVGIFVYRRFFVQQGQKVDKDEMHQYQQKDFAKTDESNVRPVRPQRHKPSKYDPRIDYNDLVWQLYYESHKGEEVAEDLKRMMDSYKPEIYWKIEGARNN